MTGVSFIWKGVRHYRAAYVGVLLGAAVGAMVLLGALMAGDSVKGSLAGAAALRTGQVAEVFSAGERFFEDSLGERAGGAAILYLKGQVNVGERAEGQVQVLGVGGDFWDYAPEDAEVKLGEGEFGVSERLAKALDLEVGSGLVVRLQKPGLLSRDAPLSGEGETVVAIRGTVGRVVTDAEFGRFSLEGTQVAPSTVFLPRKRLQEALEIPGKANLVLLGEGVDFEEGKMSLEDFGVSVVEVPGGMEVRSSRIFMGPQVEDAVREATGAEPVITYLVNTLATEVGETPYSMVTGVGAEVADFLPGDLGDDEIVINEWLSEDLSAGAGDEVTLDYFVVEAGSELVERKSVFTVKSVVPMTGAAADKRWMPDFPGVAEVKSARDWEPGLPLDLKRIRDKDDAYWEQYKGTPKAFVTAAAGEAMWANRWGKVTGLRLAGGEKLAVEEKVREVLTPELAGMHLRDFRAQAEEAAKSPVDFAMLFISMSFFLILASVALVAMLFAFNVEQRTSEGGLLAAVGISAKKVSGWRMGEALVVILLGGLIGAGLAVGFCLIVLQVIGSIWGSGGTTFSFHASVGSMFAGGLAFLELSLLSVWWTLRKQAKRSASVRLASGSEEERVGKKGTVAFLVVGVLMVFGAIGLGLTKGPQGAFFLAGFGLLLMGLGVFRVAISKNQDLGELSEAGLAKVNVSRRASRSLTVVGVLAAGVFLVLSVTAFRKDGGVNWQEKESGAGGFAWWVETTNPVNRPADAEGEVAWFGMKEGVVPFRIGTGDDVDCFNLNSTGQPRLLGVEASALEGRFHTDVDWTVLEEEGEGVPAFVDETTMMWVLKMKVGGELNYENEWGQEFTVRIAGVVKDSIFQGSLIVSEAALLEKYPSAGGYSLFLVEDEGAKEELQVATADLGGQVVSTRDRLAAFHEVENTYIAIFHVLGGLGMVLGSVGVGVVTARNLVERRGEFAILKTLGIEKSGRSAIVMSEVRILIGWGLGIGAVASMVAVLPLLGEKVKVGDLGWMMGLLAVMGLVAWGSAVLARKRSGVLDEGHGFSG
ncbi:MAG: FtsX-like permease family protein [Verrucomicrobiaceae bacterium]